MRSTGRRWALSASNRGRLVLAGGLRADNVGLAIDLVRPLAVDVSGGVEAAPGKKDPALLRAFFAAVSDASIPCSPATLEAES